MARRKKIKKTKLNKIRRRKKKIQPKNHWFWLAGGLLLGAVLVFIGFSVSSKAKISKSLPSPINYLIASLSAQTQTIKIDPEFSYTQDQIKNNPPEKIIIPSLNIDLPVTESEIVDGFWETSTDSASFGLGSAYPGEAGNSVIFAHAQVGLFANLGNIQKDSRIYVLSQDKWFSYKVVEIKTVLPTAIEVITPTQDETLTLYTCTGFRDAYRFVVVAKIIR